MRRTERRLSTTGEVFWEPGGDLIHHQAANNLPDARTTFIAALVWLSARR